MKHNKPYSNLRKFLLCMFSIVAICLTSFYLGRIIPTHKVDVPSGRKLQIYADADTEVGFIEIKAGSLTNYSDEAIRTYELKNIRAIIDTDTLTLEDALVGNKITPEEITAYAQIDARNKLCEEIAESNLGLTCILYRYPEFDLHIIYDVYELPDGTQRLIREISFYRVGSHDNINHFFPNDSGLPIDREDWGITFNTSEISSTGLVLNYSQTKGLQVGQLGIMSYYVTDEAGYALNPIDSNEIYFVYEQPMAYLQNDGNYFITIDWEEMYGHLHEGNYGLMLYVRDIYNKNEVHPLMKNYTDNQTYYIPFSIS